MPVERRHVDPRAERRLVHRDRHDDEQIVALAPEQRVRLHVHVDVQVAVRPPRVPGVPFRQRAAARRRPRRPARAPSPPRCARRVLRRRRRRSATALPARAAARARTPSRTPCARAPTAPCRSPGSADSAPSGVRTRPAPPHAPQTTCRVTTTCRSTPRIDSSNVDRQRRDADPRRAPARPSSGAGGCSTSANSSLNVAASAPLRRERKIESRELERTGSPTRPARSARGVVLLPAFRIAQRLVRLGDPVEQRFGLAVTRVDPRVIPPRQPPIRPLDLGRARARREAEDDVEVHISLRVPSALAPVDLGHPRHR